MTRSLSRPAGLLLAAALLLSLLSGCSRLSVSGLLSPSPHDDYTSPADGFRYAKSQLSPREQYVCDQLVEGIRDHAEKIDNLYPDSDLILKAAQAVEIDYPEFFWYAGGGNVELTTWNDTPLRASYQPSYTMDAAASAQAQQTIDAWTEQCLSAIPANAADNEKVLTVYEYIINHTDYGAEDSNSIANVMVGGSGLCGCYAKTTQYLLNKLNIPCTYVSGWAKGVSHAWNLLWLDGESYWLDTTWGDPVFTGGAATSGCSYDYFCITTADLLRTHTPDDKLTLPDCTAQTYNYFRYNGLYFSSYNQGTLLSAVEAALTAGKKTLSVRYADDAYPTALQTLFRKREIYSLYRQAQRDLSLSLALSDSVWYSRDDDMGTITLTLPYAT